MFNRKDISAAEARGLVAGVNWDDYVNNLIKTYNEQIRKFAELGYREARVGLWTKEQYVWDKIIEHFELKGFEVKREWCGLIFKWRGDL
jgi:hypothetical protein